MVPPEAEQPALSSQTPRIAGVVDSVLFTNRLARFFLKTKFLLVLLSVPGANQKQIIFTYEEVTSLLSKYVIMKRDQLFNPRNIKLAIVENDPLGEAFGVRCFHRCQVNNMLRSQLIPVDTRTVAHLAVVRPLGQSSPVLVASRHRPGVENDVDTAAAGSKTPAIQQLRATVRANPFFECKSEIPDDPLDLQDPAELDVPVDPLVKVPTEHKPQGVRLQLRQTPITIKVPLEKMIGGEHLADRFKHFFVDGFGPIDETQAVDQLPQSTRKTGISNLVAEGIYTSIGAHVLGPVEFKMGRHGE